MSGEKKPEILGKEDITSADKIPGFGGITGLERVVREQVVDVYVNLMVTGDNLEVDKTDAGGDGDNGYDGINKSEWSQAVASLQLLRREIVTFEAAKGTVAVDDLDPKKLGNVRELIGLSPQDTFGLINTPEKFAGMVKMLELLDRYHEVSPGKGLLQMNRLDEVDGTSYGWSTNGVRGNMTRADFMGLKKQQKVRDWLVQAIAAELNKDTGLLYDIYVHHMGVQRREKESARREIAGDPSGGHTGEESAHSPFGGAHSPYAEHHVGGGRYGPPLEETTYTASHSPPPQGGPAPVEALAKDTAGGGTTGKPDGDGGVVETISKDQVVPRGSTLSAKYAYVTLPEGTQYEEGMIFPEGTVILVGRGSIPLSRTGNKLPTSRYAKAHLPAKFKVRIPTTTKDGQPAQLKGAIILPEGCRVPGTIFHKAGEALVKSGIIESEDTPAAIAARTSSPSILDDVIIAGSTSLGGTDTGAFSIEVAKTQAVRSEKTLASDTGLFGVAADMAWVAGTKVSKGDVVMPSEVIFPKNYVLTTTITTPDGTVYNPGFKFEGNSFPMPAGTRYSEGTVFPVAVTLKAGQIVEAKQLTFPRTEYKNSSGVVSKTSSARGGIPEGLAQLDKLPEVTEGQKPGIEIARTGLERPVADFPGAGEVKRGRPDWWPKDVPFPSAEQAEKMGIPPHLTEQFFGEGVSQVSPPGGGYGDFSPGFDGSPGGYFGGERHIGGSGYGPGPSTYGDFSGGLNYGLDGTVVPPTEVEGGQAAPGLLQQPTTQLANVRSASFLDQQFGAIRHI